MKYNEKDFISVGIGLLCTLFGIVAVIELNRISERNIYLEQTIEQQTMLIEYLRGEDESNRFIK